MVYNLEFKKTSLLGGQMELHVLYIFVKPEARDF